jgi:hypothetical protein
MIAISLALVSIGLFGAHISDLYLCRAKGPAAVRVDRRAR